MDDLYVSTKGLARELNLPIWSVSQVNRAGAKDDVIEGDKELLRYVDITGYFFKKEPLKRTFPKFVEPEPIKPLTPEQLKELGIS